MKWHTLLGHTIVMIIMSMAMLGCGQNKFSKDSENASEAMNDDRQPQTNTGAKKPPASDQTSGQTSSTLNESDPAGQEAQIASSMPYYCDPLRYPPNIINNITACKPFVGLASPSYYGSGPIGYRMRYDLLYPGYRYYGNDDHRHHGSWRNHRHRFENGKSKHSNGFRRSMGRP